MESPLDGLESACEVVGTDEVEEIESAFRRTHLGQVDMEKANRIGVELLPLRWSLPLRAGG